MKYLLLIYEDEKRFANGIDPGELAEYYALDRALGPGLVDSHALGPTSHATTVRVRDGQARTTAGPFAVTQEQLGAYYLIEAKNQHEAEAVAARIPGARTGCVEVRPILQLD